jgi:hypothetical protein
MKEKHLVYNLEKATTAYNKLDKSSIELQYYTKEFIEHSCAFILSLYSLFIGLGKLRPLITLHKYLEFSVKNSENELLWSESLISNIHDDLKSINRAYGLSKLQHILGKIKVQINSVEKEYDKVKANFDIIFDIITNLKEKYDFLLNINEIRSKNDMLNISINLFSFYNKIRFDENEKCLIFDNEYVKYIGEFVKYNIRLAGIFVNDKNEYEVLNLKTNRTDINYIIIVANKKIEPSFLKKLIAENSILNEEFTSLITIDELLSLTRSCSREKKIVEYLKENIQ